MKDEKTIAAELTPEQIQEGKRKLWEMISKACDADGIPQDWQKKFYKDMSKDEQLINLFATGQEKKAYKRFSELAVRALPDDPIAEYVDEGGKREKFSTKDFFSLMINMHESKDAADQLKFWIGAMIEEAERTGLTAENDIAAKTVEAMQMLYDAITKAMQPGETAAELEKFLQDPAAFMPIARPAGIEDLLSVYSAGKKDVIVKEFESGNKVTGTGRLGLDERKIDEMIRLYFISNNHYRAKTGLNTLIELPLKETMDILGKARTKDNIKKFAAQLRKEILPAIAHQHLEMTAPNGTFLHLEVGGGYYAADVRKDKIYFTVSDPYALYLNTGSLRQYSSITLRLGTAKKPLAFYLAMKMQDHYYSDRNRAKGTNGILSIKTLLDFSSDIIPSYLEVQRTDRGHWQERIRKLLEDALTEMQDKGLLTWEYCKKSLGAVTPQEIRTNDYRQWSKLYITFEIIPKEPDQAQRLENKRERIEAAAEKKAIKDAKALVQADKIEQRKTRAGSKSK